MTNTPIFLRRVELQNYMSIARCSIRLGPLSFFVGRNGSGKSNFLDALRFVAESLRTTVEHALRERGGIGEVRRRSSGHPTHFRVSLQWGLPDGSDGTLRTLGVLVALFQAPPSSGHPVPVVGIEEPETALHPGAAGLLRSALFEASLHTQVLVTSHSPDLLDDKEITERHLVSVICDEGRTVLGPIDPPSRSLIRDHLFTAGELLRLGQIGVEAPDESMEALEEPELFR